MNEKSLADQLQHDLQRTLVLKCILLNQDKSLGDMGKQNILFPSLISAEEGRGKEEFGSFSVLS